MKFGEKLHRDSIGELKANYVDYGKWQAFSLTLADALKNILKEEPMSHEAFQSLVAHELQKLDYFTLGKMTELINWSDYISKHPFEDGVEQEIAKICDTAVLLEKFLYQNCEAFRKILKKYKKHSNGSTEWFADMRPKSHLYRPQAFSIMHEIAVQLSCAVQRRLESGDAVWEPPSSFNRKTTKYWVPTKHIFALKMFLLQRVPILEVNKSQHVDLDFTERKFEQVHNYISSVYYDSPELDCYSRRIIKEEGAELIRIRWYGGVFPTHQDVFPIPTSSSQSVFVERKTHHEGAPSVKERFKFPLCDLPALLTGQLDTDEYLAQQAVQQAEKSKSGEQTAEARAKSAEKLEYSKDLARAVQSSVLLKSLRPICRTVYHRTAFQSATNNEGQVRLSLDSPLFLYPEKAAFHQDPTLENVSAFYSNLQGPSSNDAEPFHFQYGVLEVKLQGGGPEWLDELMGKGWLQQMSFSKFQHTLAANYPDLVTVNPAWMSILEEARRASKDEKPYRADHSDPALLTSITETKEDEQDAISTTAVHGSTAYSADHQHFAALPNANPSHATAQLTRIAFGGINNTYPAGVTGSDSSHPPASSLSGQSAPGSNPAAFNWFAKEKAKAADAKAKPAAKAKPKGVISKLKIEPKTFFANERTFLKWMQLTVLLVTLSTGLLAIDDSRTRLAGTLFFPIAISFVAYAVMLFLWRVRVLLFPTLTGVSQRFDEPYGPALFGIAIMAALIATLILVWVPLNYNNGLPQGITIVSAANCLPLSVYPSSLTSYQVPTGMSVVQVLRTMDNTTFPDLFNTTNTSTSAPVNIVVWPSTVAWMTLPRQLLVQTPGGAFKSILTVAPPTSLQGIAVTSISLSAQSDVWTFLLTDSTGALKSCRATNITASHPTITCQVVVLAAQTAVTAVASFAGNAYLAVSSSYGVSIVIADLATGAEINMLTISQSAVQSGVDALSTATSSAINKAPVQFVVTTANMAIAGLAVSDSYIFVLMPSIRILVVLDTSPTSTGEPRFFALPGATANVPQYTSLSALPSATAAQYYIYLAQPFPTGVQRFTLDLATGFVPCCVSCGGVFSIGSF